MRLSRVCFLYFLFILLLSFSAATQPNIRIIYPKDGEPVFSVDSIFVFGSVQPPEASVLINKLPVTVFPNGAFLKMIPLAPKRTRVQCQASIGTDTTQQTITVFTPDLFITSPTDSLLFDSTFIFPQTDIELRAGDILRVAVKGTPDCKAVFYVDSLTEEIPMFEIAASRRYFWGRAAIGGRRPTKRRGVKGVYSGIYRIAAEDRADSLKIHFKLTRAGWDTVQIIAPGSFSIDTLAAPRFARLPKSPYANPVKYGVGKMHILPENTIFQVTGQYGAYLRIQFEQQEQLWMKLDTLQYLAPDKKPVPGVIYTVRASQPRHRTQVSVRLNQCLPVKIEQLNNPVRFLITFYGIHKNNNKIYNLNSAPEIKTIEWITRNDVADQLLIEMKREQLWGYTSEFKNNSFVLEIKNPPQIATEPLSALNDMVITLDPGHNPDLGAVGPTGLTEKDVNLQVCHSIKKHLEQKGALVVLTRENEQGVALTTRPLLASFVDSDVLLSVHFNSLPDGVNPYKNHGTSTYYFQPMSYPLAHTIHESLLNHLQLPDFGLFHRGFVLTRPTDLLSVLIEPAFIIHPEEEMLIRSPEFQEKIALAITEALENFFASHRRVE